MSASGRDKKIGSGRIVKQQLFKRRTRGGAEPPPLFNGDEHRGFRPAFGHHLGTFGDASFQELAEASFRVLDRPGIHR